MRLTRTNSVYCPGNLEIDGVSPQVESGIRYICFFLIKDRIFREPEFNRFTPIHWQHLRDVIGQGYDKMSVDAAEDLGIIEVNPRYNPGNWTRSYRLTPEYFNATWVRHEITGNTSRYLKKKNRDYQQLLPVEKHLKKNLYNITINYVPPSVFEAIDGNSKVQQFRKRRAALIAIDLIRKRDWRFTVCRYGRVHTNVTSLSRHLRPFLRYRGQPLIGVDCACSQPMVWAWMPLHTTSLRVYAGKNDWSNICKPFENNGLGKEKRVLFLRLCEQGSLYEYFMERTGGTREEAKLGFLKCIFQNWRREGKGNPILKVIRSNFPEVYDFLSNVTVQGDEMFGKRNGYKTKAHLAQRWESDMFIRVICQRMMDEYPAIPTITLHDAIYTTEPHLETLEKVMLEEFQKMGITPTLKRT